MPEDTPTSRRLDPAALRQFTGDLERYRHPLNRSVIYTPGLHYVAEQGGAYWLIDALALTYGTPAMKRAIAADERLASLQFWRLDVRQDRSAVLIMRADSGVPPAITQKIPFTDFPLEQIDIWAGFDGQHWTLYLPSEH